MNKEKGTRQSGQQDDEKRSKDAAESLTSFSKHLMLLLVAVIAFASAPVLNDTPRWLQLCFALGVILGIASFIAGHEGITKILSAYIKKDSKDNFVNLKDSLNKGTLQSCKMLIELQYWLMLLSLIIIAASIVLSVFVDKDKTHTNCILTNSSSNQTQANTQQRQSDIAAKSVSTIGKNNPNSVASQQKLKEKPVKP